LDLRYRRGGLKQSAGHGKLVYAMRVDEKLTREEYYNNPRFAKKKPTNTNAEKSRGDNEKPISNFEKRDQFVLLSKRFYYFGKDAIDIREFKLEANARGFHYVGQDDFLRLLDYLQKHYELGKQGEPCGRVADQAKEIARCKSSC
jgi:Nucleotide modification associated domain 2